MSKKENLVGDTAEIIMAINKSLRLTVNLRLALDREANAVPSDEQHLRWFIKSGPFTKVDAAMDLLNTVESLLQSAQDDIRKYHEEETSN